MNKKDEPRLRQMVIRVNDHERKKIETNASKLGLTVSDFGRQLMISGKVMTVQKIEVQTEFQSLDRRTIIGLANNLNQLTKYAHERRELPQIEELLKNIERIIAKW